MNLMDTIISLCKRRGFIFPGSEIYGGLANSWDFGPLGVELKNNIKGEWWKMFVHDRDDMVGIDAAIIMNPKVWEASGHLAEFSDPLVECSKCKGRFRADHLKNTKNCPTCKNILSQPRQFNMLFKTHVGPAEDSSRVVYLRPETAQGIFVNFEHIVTTSRKRIPFGIGQIGKAFRNEITPGNFIFRTLEFEQMEIEYFIDGTQWKTVFDRWIKDMKKWMKHLGLKDKHITIVEISKKKLAHYSKRTIDIFYEFPFGSEELYGLAYRGNFDLKNHGLQYTDPITNVSCIPHVIEPTFGVERSVLAALVEHYVEEKVKGDTRVVLKFPYWLAPYKVAILPLSKDVKLSKIARSIYKKLLGVMTIDYDETQSIGKRYRRQDEIGTPFCVTVDFDSINDGKVTVRNRDTMKQERININKVQEYIQDSLLNNYST